MILADTRENNGANPFLDTCVIENNKENAYLARKISGGDMEFRIKQITVGDYCILLRDKQKPENIITAMVIERKTWKDLAASIKDGRINEQHAGLINIQKKRGCLVCYIIEGNAFYKDDTDIGNIAFKNLHAKLRHNMIRGIPYIHTKDEMHTAKVITLLARDLMKMYATDEISFPKQAPITLEEKKYNEYQNYLNELKKLNAKYTGIDDLLLSASVRVEKKIEIENQKENEKENEKEEQDFQVYEIKEANYCKDQIPKDLTENRLRTDAEILLNMWAAIPGVSIKSAAQIANKIHIREALTVRDDTVLTIKNKIADVEYASGRKFGIAKAKKIIDHIAEKETQIKILAEITGITEPTAKIILEKYPVKDICNGFVIMENISELKNKTRKVGNAAAENIIRILRKPL